MDWSNLSATQWILDERIRKEKDLEDEDLFEETLLALRVELGEYANETRCFKHWSSKDQSGAEIRMMEWVDGLHFYISLINEKYHDPANRLEYAERISKGIKIPKAPHSKREKQKQLTWLLNRSFDFLDSRFLVMDLEESLAHFLRAAILDGFTLDELVKGYYIKNKINHERQDQGY